MFPSFPARFVRPTRNSKSDGLPRLGILAIWNLCWAVFASFQVDRWGRRFLFLTSAAGMTLFFTLQTICSAQYAIHGTQAAAHAVIAFIFLFYAFYE